MNNNARNIVICVDGTWVSPGRFQSGDRAVSNAMKMSRMVEARNSITGRDQIILYNSGIGALKKYPGFSNHILRRIERYLAGVWGAGFESGIETVAETLTHNYLEGDRVFLFGFSRGAAQLRALTHFVDWLGGLPKKTDTLFLPSLFWHYLLGDQIISDNKSNNEIHIESINGKVLTSYCLKKKLKPIKFELLAVWDTVLALGSRLLSIQNTSTPQRAHLIQKKPARCVKNARQALAVDEKRWDYRPEIWTNHNNNQSLEQRWLPGTHSDIGGGTSQGNVQEREGLANISFQWFVQEAKILGLAFSPSVLTLHYLPDTSAPLHDSMNLVYKISEILRFQIGKGVRKIDGFPRGANVKLDQSVLYRMIKKELDTPYRPKNIISMLNKQSNIKTYIKNLDSCLDLCAEALNKDPRTSNHVFKGSDF